MVRRVALLVIMMLSLQLVISAAEVLQNEDIVKLVRAGFSSDTIVDKINLSSAAFDLSTDALIALKGEKVPESVIRAMMAKQAWVEHSATPAASAEMPPSQLQALELPKPTPALTPASPSAPPTPPAKILSKRRKTYEVDIHRTRYTRCPGEIQLDAAGITAKRCKDLDFKISWKEIESICFLYEFTGRMKIKVKDRIRELSTITPAAMKEIRDDVRKFAPDAKETTCKE